MYFSLFMIAKSNYEQNIMPSLKLLFIPPGLSSYSFTLPIETFFPFSPEPSFLSTPRCKSTNIETNPTLSESLKERQLRRCMSAGSHEKDRLLVI